jgi:hypothetical protein
MSTMKQALDVKAKVSELLRGLPGISGVGVTWDASGQPVVRVNVANGMGASDRRRIPSQLDKVPILVEEVGAIAFE